MKYLFKISLIFLSVISYSQQKNLKYYLDTAIHKSPLLRDIGTQISLNGLDTQIVRKNLYPQVNAVSNAYYAPVINGYGYDEALTNIHTFNAMIQVTQPLFEGRNIDNQVKLIQLQNQSLYITKKLTELDIRKTITEQYITAYSDLMQLYINEEILNMLIEGEQALKRLAERGVYKETEYLNFMITVNQQEVQLKQLHIQYANDFGILNLLSGLNDTAFTDLKEPDLDVVKYIDLTNSYLYKQYVLDSIKLKYSHEQIDYNYLPKVNLTFDAGYNSSFTIQPYKNFGFSIGANITIPLFDWGRKQLEHQRLYLSEKYRRDNLDYTINQYNQQINILYQQLNLIDDANNKTEEGIAYSEALVAANNRLLNTGDVRVVDYIMALNNYITGKKTIIMNRVSKYQIINQLNYWSKAN